MDWGHKFGSRYPSWSILCSVGEWDSISSRDKADMAKEFRQSKPAVSFQMRTLDNRQSQGSIPLPDVNITWSLQFAHLPSSRWPCPHVIYAAASLGPIAHGPAWQRSARAKSFGLQLSNEGKRPDAPQCRRQCPERIPLQPLPAVSSQFPAISSRFPFNLWGVPF